MKLATVNDITKSMNKSVAFATRRIPYIPELRKYCNTITASLLMVQLEYRFASMSEGFYKFLSPCEHPRYRAGDSWTEEMNFSEGEFRGAFDNIGIRYTSKTALKDYFDQNGNDVFQGKAYLSYRDIKSGLTYYLRNHTLADCIIEEAVNKFSPPPPTQECGSDDESLELRLPQFQRLDKPSSRTPESVSLNKEHKKTAKEDTGEGRAGDKFDYSERQKKSAALSNDDLLIADKLTEKQIEFVISAAKELLKKTICGSYLQLAEQITESLVSPNHFKQAGKDFLFKLNSIKKAIKNGKWTPPVEKIVEQQQQAEQALAELNRKIREKKISIETDKNLALHSPDKAFWETTQQDNRDEYDALVVERNLLLESCKSTPISKLGRI